MKSENIDNETPLIYWELNDDTDKAKWNRMKKYFLWAVIFIAACVLGFHAKEIHNSTFGVTSYETSVGTGDNQNPNIDSNEEDDFVEEKFKFHGEEFDAEELCEKYNCGPGEGSCLFLPKGDGSALCEEDPKYYTSKALCNYNKGVWCVNIYKDPCDDVICLQFLCPDGRVPPTRKGDCCPDVSLCLNDSDVEAIDFEHEDSDEDEDEDFQLQLHGGVEINPISRYETAVGALSVGVHSGNKLSEGNISSRDWCDCKKKGDLEIRGTNRDRIFTIKPDGHWYTVVFEDKVPSVRWRCTGGGGWERAGFACEQSMLAVKFTHQRKHCPSKWRKRTSGRIHWY